MNDYDNIQPRDAFFSKRIRAGKRTYYFDVKATRGNDFYLTITESKRKPGESDDRPFFEKHKLFLYKEDFEKFTEGFHEALEYIREKRELIPEALREPYHQRQQQADTITSNAYTPETITEQVAEETFTSEQPLIESPVSSFTNVDFDDLGK